MGVLVFCTPCLALVESQELLVNDDVQDWFGYWDLQLNEQNGGDSLFPIAYTTFHSLHTQFFDWSVQGIGRCCLIPPLDAEAVARVVGC